VLRLTSSKPAMRQQLEATSLAQLLLPFVSGVTEYDLVNDAYVRARIEAEDSQQ